MEVEVYADLLFLINAAMDGLCLLLTGRLLHRRVKPWRVALASVLGGVYAVAALFPEVGTVLSLLLDAAVCLIMCALVFGGRGRSRAYEETIRRDLTLPAPSVRFSARTICGLRRVIS